MTEAESTAFERPRIMAALDITPVKSHGGHEPATRTSRLNLGAMDWDDVRVFLAVARKGSMRAAARALGLSQPTIARRLAAFEAGFGGQPCSTACRKGCASTTPASNLWRLPRASRKRF